jgi:aminodeoxychorismate synthase, component I, bacterial clade
MSDEFALLDDGGDGCWLLHRPARIVACDTADDVDRSLAAIEAGLADGLTAAGFFAYELGYALEPRLAPLMPAARPVPLLRIGLFRDARWLSRRDARAWLAARVRGPCRVGALPPGLDRAQYRAAFATVHDLIAAGDVYQINLTFKQRLRIEGDPLALYLDLQRRQRVNHGGLIVAPGLSVLSLSPELFLRVDNGRALMRPMKGTAARARTPDEDRTRARWLAADEKSRAENLMIVDLLRNDLGRLAPVGGVRVTDLYTVETLRTLHQMTSGIEATLQPDVGVARLLRAIFPCGSVTGAPKIRAMEIIRAIETEPRGLYTGAIAMLRRDARGGLDLHMNVAIRTLVVDAAGQGELGIGSGVVSDSDADLEYDECLLKARFVSDRTERFALIETLRWDRSGGYALLDRHLDRLATSAVWFGIAYDDEGVRQQLATATASFGEPAMRVRLLLDEDGEATLTAAPLPERPAVLHYAVSPRPQPSDDPFRYHKTTRREGYAAELARLKAATGCDEVLFVNERGELTEGSWTNLFVRRHDRLLTPASRCGLLPGTLRAELLAAGEAVEAILRLEDLATAEAIFLGNSVRGLIPAVPVGAPAHPSG